MYNTAGQLITTLFDETDRENEVYNVELNTTGLPNGIYLYKLITPNDNYIGQIYKY